MSKRIALIRKYWYSQPERRSYSLPGKAYDIVVVTAFVVLGIANLVM